MERRTRSKTGQMSADGLYESPARPARPLPMAKADQKEVRYRLPLMLASGRCIQRTHHGLLICFPSSNQTLPVTDDKQLHHRPRLRLYGQSRCQ
jgi:hypothetical protein